MNRLNRTAAATAIALVALAGCRTETASDKESRAVNRQQEQYAIGQPIPAFDWSLERDMIIQLYDLRNQNVATHSVWRSITGMILYDCPSIGFGIPYDASLTNPLMLDRKWVSDTVNVSGVIEQAEPNGIFASKNTAATWVMCAGRDGDIEPVYIESTVNVYPYPMTVDYETNRVSRNGDASVRLKGGK